MPTSDLLSVHDAAKILNKTHVAVVNLCQAKILDGGFNEAEVGYRITADSVRAYAAREESRKAHPATGPLPRHTVGVPNGGPVPTMLLESDRMLTADEVALIKSLRPRTLLDVEDARADDPLNAARGVIVGLLLGVAFGLAITAIVWAVS